MEIYCQFITSNIEICFIIRLETADFYGNLLLINYKYATII